MIVVIGQPLLRAAALGGGLDGTPARAAAAAAAAGRDVQLVGSVGDDPDGDALVLELTRARIGHAALLRDPARPTPVVVADAGEDDESENPGSTVEPADPAARPALDPADVELALRYFTDLDVVAVAEAMPPALVEAAAAAAAYAGARLIVVLESGREGPPDATLLEQPQTDPDGAFATFLGAFAAKLDAGDVAAGGIAATATSLGWTRPEPN